MSKTVTVTALRQLKGAYGTKIEGDVFDVDENAVESLEARGLVARGSKKVTDKVIEKAEEKRAETLTPDASGQKSSGPTENKAVDPAANKSATKK